jgi:hypothetical protein
VAVIDSAISAQGWIALDLPRTLKDLPGAFQRPVFSLGGRIKVPGSALGGAVTRPAALPPLLRSAARPARGWEASRPAFAAPPSALKRSPASAPAPQPRPPRRVPEADIVFVGRRPAKAASAVPLVESRSTPVPKIRKGVRPWLAILSALAFAGIGFYLGTQWTPCHAITLPAALSGKGVIV